MGVMERMMRVKRQLNAYIKKGERYRELAKNKKQVRINEGNNKEPIYIGRNKNAESFEDRYLLNYNNRIISNNFEFSSKEKHTIKVALTRRNFYVFGF